MPSTSLSEPQGVGGGRRQKATSQTLRTRNKLLNRSKHGIRFSRGVSEFFHNGLANLEIRPTNFSAT